VAVVVAASPSRLTLARQRRGYTLSQVAKAVALTPAAISLFESGERTPSPETLARLAHYLEFPVDFFTAGDVEPLEAATDRERPTSSVASFRSLRSLTVRNRARALAVGVLAVELFELIESKLVIPALAIPDLQGEKPELAAASLRAAWGLGDGPIFNCVHLLEAKGVRVFWSREECREVDAFSFWRDGRPYVMLGTHKTAERSRRDAAHELAHLVLHQHGDVCGREAEQEAEAFASAFLTPSEQFARECPLDPRDADILALKRRWMISRQSTVRRMFDVGRIGEWRYRSEFIAMSQAGRDNEPDPIERETSLLFAKALPKLLEVGLGLDVIAAELCLPLRELLNLVPVNEPERWVTAIRQRPVLRLVGE
jgi:Zn-dependent peptidase ImmA (M78 family)/transcriptional regulator with XRE-family HTH domain